MRQLKPKSKPAKIVWRISDSAPLGEVVDPEHPLPDSVPPEPAADLPPHERARGWHHSSHDLAQGIEVHEEPLDTLPDELIEQLFRKP